VIKLMRSRRRSQRPMLLRPRPREVTQKEELTLHREYDNVNTSHRVAGPLLPRTLSVISGKVGASTNMGNRGAAVHAAALELFEVIAVMLAKSKSLWFCHGTEIELSLAVFIRKYMIKLTPRILLNVSINFCAAIQVFGRHDTRV